MTVIENTQLGFNFLLAVEMYRKMGSTVTSFSRLEGAPRLDQNRRKRKEMSYLFFQMLNGVSLDFWLQVFFMNLLCTMQFFWRVAKIFATQCAQPVSLTPVANLYHRCHWNRRPHLSAVSPAVNLQAVPTTLAETLPTSQQQWRKICQRSQQHHRVNCHRVTKDGGHLWQRCRQIAYAFNWTFSKKNQCKV